MASDAQGGRPRREQRQRPTDVEIEPGSAQQAEATEAHVQRCKRLERFESPEQSPRSTEEYARVIELRVRAIAATWSCASPLGELPLIAREPASIAGDHQHHAAIAI
jgi:hypothetical protein